MYAIIFDYAHLLTDESLTIRPEAKTVIPDLYWRGYRLFLLTHGKRYEDVHWLKEQLQTAGILAYFEHVTNDWNSDAQDIVTKLLFFSCISPVDCLIVSQSNSYLERLKDNGCITAKCHLGEVEKFLPRNSSLNYIEQYTIERIRINKGHLSSPISRGSNIFVNGKEYIVTSDQNVTHEDILESNKEIELDIELSGIRSNKNFDKITSNQEPCIALIYYENNSHNRNYHDLLIKWFDYYAQSGTQLPVRIFGLQDGPERIAGCSIENILSIPHGMGKELTTSDLLRSGLYKHIQNRFVYLDLDCFLLKPIDDILETTDRIGMCLAVFSTSCLSASPCFNSGVIVFAEDCEDAFKQEFDEQEYKQLQNSYPGDQVQRHYGQTIWSKVNHKIGTCIDSKWNCRKKSDLDESTMIWHDVAAEYI